MQNLTNAIKRHLVVAFYILAFVVYWIGWIPRILHGEGIFPFENLLIKNYLLQRTYSSGHCQPAIDPKER
jgi:hypothetical protein